MRTWLCSRLNSLGYQLQRDWFNLTPQAPAEVIGVTVLLAVAYLLLKLALSPTSAATLVMFGAPFVWASARRSAPARGSWPAQLEGPELSQRRADWRNAVLVAVLGLTLGGLYFVAIDLQAPNYSFTQQQNVLSGLTGSPYRYRVLVPFVLDGLTHALAFLGSTQTAYLGASLVYDCVALAFQFLMLYALFRQFFSPLHSLLGVSFVSGVTILTLAYFTYQPWSILEVAFFALGFLLAYRGQWVWVGVTVVLAPSIERLASFFHSRYFWRACRTCDPSDRRTASRGTPARDVFVVCVTGVVNGHLCGTPAGAR